MSSTVRRDVVAYGLGGTALGLLFGVLIAPVAALGGVMFAAVGVGSRYLQRRLN